MAQLIVAFFGVLVAALGFTGVLFPWRLLHFVRLWQSRTMLYVAALIRIALGVAMLIAAPDTRAPSFMFALGALIVIIGIATPFFGLDRFRAVLNWWTSRSAIFQRAWAFVAMAFGIGLVYLSGV